MSKKTSGAISTENSSLLSAKLIFTVIFSVSAALTPLFLTGCAKAGSTISQAPQAPQVQSQKKQVMASFYPLYIMLLNLTENVEDVEVTMLAPADTGCLHDYQLTTRDMKNLEKCSLLVMNGAGMEDFVEKAVELKDPSQIITASEGYELVDDNAHVWVSPSGAVHQVNVIARGLEEWDGENAELYRENARIYVEKIQALSSRMHSRLDKYAGTKIITFHEAFPYFADEFNLVTVATIERDAGEDPNPRELSELLKMIKEEQTANGKIVLFAEPQYSSSAAQIIANETGLTVAELDPAVTAEKIRVDKNAYLDAMEKNLEVLETSFNELRKN